MGGCKTNARSTDLFLCVIIFYLVSSPIFFLVVVIPNVWTGALAQSKLWQPINILMDVHSKLAGSAIV